MERYRLQESMSFFWHGRILLPLLHLAFLFMGFLAKAPPGSSLIQTPASLNVLEGSTLNMSCTFNGNITSKWFLKWFHCKNGNQVELKNSNPRVNITSKKDPPFSCLILDRADIDDSGIYQCRIGDLKNHNLYRNETEVIVNEITDLMVNQTPKHLNKLEGENVTLKCNFRTVSNLSTMYVRWKKNTTELSNGMGPYRITEDLEKGFTSLTILNAEKSNSGVYKCEVGSSLRNRSGSGDGSYLVVTEHTKQLDPETATENAGTRFGLSAGAGAGAGTFLLLLLLLLGILVWIYTKKKRAKSTPGVRLNTEAVPTEEVKKHPPATNQVSDVTYVDLNFHRREVQPATEVIYAEVRSRSKQ
ncbi:endothelial cell-selective adhesion molecule-like [Sceloporus undulatus]|uniref:endothelial cell-selective adhesion molecule-like n=1 Tax=Sceloporus undulatus TaxID=8520 RepID=UPI001C4B303D|nr:endothelial cell-selective adhesion molecule-like [Sceloporus undulatus]